MKSQEQDGDPPSELEFRPNLFVDISGYFSAKMHLFKEVYKSQFTESERSAYSVDGLESYAQYRGLEAGTKYAEAFQLLRGLL